MWLLIKDGSYSRAAFINFGPMLGYAAHKNRSTEDWFTKTANLRCSRIKSRLSSAMVWPQMSERIPLAIVTTPTQSSSCMCAATISFTEFQMRLLLDGG